MRGGRSFPIVPFSLVLLGWCAAVACTGSITRTGVDSRGPGGSLAAGGDGQPGGKDPGGGQPSLDQPGPLPLLRLDNAQYANTVHDLFGIDVPLADILPLDAVDPSGFKTGGSIASNDADRLWTAAATVATAAVKSLANFAPCPAGQAEATCVSNFIAMFGARAYRRPLTDNEAADLKALYDSARTTLGYDYAGGVRVVLEGMLQNPWFLYRWELAPLTSSTSSVVALSGYARASRLSYFLWNSMPDAALFSAASAGNLVATADVETQIRRMLIDSRARQGIARFHVQWIGIDDIESVPKSTTAFAGFSPSWLTSMKAEATAFSQSVVFDGDHKFSSYFQAPFTFVDANLAPLYGMPIPTGNALTKVDLDPSQRAGFLTQLGFLSTYATPTDSHPVKRGRVIYENVLCGALPPMPPNVPPASAPSPNVTTRQRFDDHAQNVCAKACHQLIDPYGFAMEEFDALGRFRTTDNGAPVDASGTASLPSGDSLSFKNAVDLIHGLAKSDDALACYARNWFRYALGREESPGDQASLDGIVNAFTKSGGDIQELVVAAATSRSFLFRSIDAGEVNP